MNVLGVLFDSKLNWQSHVEQTISKAKKSLHAIRLIKKFFNKDELLQLVTSNYFSILYYNSEIWHIPTLNANTKQSLLSASSSPLKICIREYDLTMSFAKLHSLAKRADPPHVMQYKHALQLFKVYNNSNSSFDWLSLFFNQNFNDRATTVKLFDTSRYKIGKNLLANRFKILNNKIQYDWLNMTLESFKIKCKCLFMC